MKEIIKNLFYKSWWIVAFTLFCGVLYENGLKNREGQYRQLSDQLNRLQMEKQCSIELQKNLQLQINSQNDISWIEQVLIKILGVIPEGQQKVFFYKEESIKEKNQNPDLL